MNMQRLKAADRKLSDQLSQIQEDRDPEPQEHRPCVSPPVLPPQSQRSDTDDPAMLALYEQQRKLEDNKCLLQELARIEQELRESLGREVEKQRELDDTRMEENRVRWRSLCYLSLNQRITKPFVTSYYRNFPMHIYCLPIQSEEHKQNKKKKKRKR